MGCDNSQKVLRRRGWTFPPLPKCRRTGKSVTRAGNGAARKSLNGSPRNRAERRWNLAKWRNTTWRKLATPGRNPGSEPSEQEMSACSASFQGVRNAKPSAPQALLSFVPLVPLLEKSNKKEGEWWSSLPPHWRLRWSKWHKRNMRHMRHRFIVRALARLTRTYRPQLKTQYEAFAAQDELRYTGFRPQ